MICPKCGAALADRTPFCNVCGAPQEQQPQQPQQPQFQQPVYQQPTYAQQVYQDRQTARQYAAPEQAPVKEKKPGKKFPVLPVAIGAAVLLVAVLVLVLCLAFGKKTVYLIAENEVENQSSITRYTYEYTEDGKILYYEYEVEYKDDYYYYVPDDIHTSFTYSYDKKGVLESAEFEVDGEIYEFEYVYDKNGDLKGLEGDGQEFKVKCDDDGRITSVKSDGDDYFSAKYSYHDNGVMKKASIRSGGSELEYRYDEQGRLLETTNGYDGTVQSSTENKYDEDGRVIENITKYYSYGELYQTGKVAFTYEKGLPVAYEIQIKVEDQSVTLVFETEDEGLERVFELTDMKLKGMDADDLLNEEEREMFERVTIEMIYDEQGHLLELVMEAPEVGVLNRQSNSYVELKLPRNFVMNYQDPIYFQQIDATYGEPASYSYAEETPAATEARPPQDAPADSNY